MSLVLPVRADAPVGATSLAFRFGYDATVIAEDMEPILRGVEVTAIPEPGTYALLLAGLLSMLGIARRRA